MDLHDKPLQYGEMPKQARQFYETVYQKDIYTSPEVPESHSAYARLSAFIKDYNLEGALCLEVGSGRGGFQDLVSRYIGMDIAQSVGVFYHKPFVVASATSMPFRSGSFDAIWTVYVFEHVPEPEMGLQELWRVLRPGGYLYFEPAWHCRPWAAEGYPVRPYSDFGLKGKVIKASIPLRDSLFFRALKTFPVRMFRMLKYLVSKQPTKFSFGHLRPNYDVFWMSDSDAVNSMDPFDAYLWFVSRGGKCLNYPTIKKALLMRHGPLIIQKPLSNAPIRHSPK